MNDDPTEEKASGCCWVFFAKVHWIQMWIFEEGQCTGSGKKRELENGASQQTYLYEGAPVN